MNKSAKDNNVPVSKAQKKGYQFGTFQGVFTPSILTILGVIMYLRFGWVLGNLGLAKTLLIVTMSTAVTFVTGLSIAQFATNMRMGGGGAYYIISRSLGIEAGAAIGIPLFFAQALGISFYIAGFSESIVGLYPGLSLETIGIATLIFLTLLAAISADLALKVQYVILFFLTTSLFSFFAGGHVSSPMVQTGTSVSLGKASFWAVFAVFFPAVTGIEAGLAMSGDLKDPERSLPRGIIGAVLVSYLIYLAIPTFLHFLRIPVQELLTNNLIMRDVARWGELVIYGLWCASLSSALGSLLGAPRTLQALANDGIVFRFIGRGYGKKNDPRFATMISFGVALLGVMLGSLNAIATLLTMFFLISYGLLNFTAGLEGMIANPSWRPRFRLKWVWPMVGAAGCAMIMLMIDPGATIIAAVIIVAVYYVNAQRKLRAYWGDMKYGILMLMIRQALYKLAEKKPHEKTWRPNILVLSGAPSSRWHLIELADALSHGKGFLTVGAVLSGEEAHRGHIEQMEKTIYGYLKERFVPAVVKVVTSRDLFQGIRSLVQTYGFGPLVPNTILMGETGRTEDSGRYAELFHYIFSSKRNLVVVREPQVENRDRAMAQIDLWWSHVGENAGLMLALAYLLKTSPEWRGARLVIKSIVNKEEERQQQEEYFRKFIAQENMEAGIEIFVRGNADAFELMYEQSRDADYVFMGLKPPAPDESIEAYGRYYMSFRQRTGKFSALVCVLAAEEIDFEGIFKLKEAR